MRGGSAPTVSKQRIVSTRRSSTPKTKSSLKGLTPKATRPKKEDLPSSSAAKKEEDAKRRRGRPRLTSNDEPTKNLTTEHRKSVDESKLRSGESKVSKRPPKSRETENDIGDAVKKRDKKLVNIKKEKVTDDNASERNAKSETVIKQDSREKSLDDSTENVQVKVEKTNDGDKVSDVNADTDIDAKPDDQLPVVKNEDFKEIDSLSSSNVTSPSSSIVTSQDGSTKLSKTSAQRRHRAPNRPGIDFSPGARLEACDFMQKWYPSKIVDVDWEDQEVLIHFERWSSRFDEWVSMDSPRLRAVMRTSARKEHRKKLQEEFKIGETVLARWVDGTMYPAKITSMNTNGTCQVTFRDDGVQKIAKLINLKKLSKEEYLSIPTWIKNQSPPNAEREKSGSKERRKSQDQERRKPQDQERRKPPEQERRKPQEQERRKSQEKRSSSGEGKRSKDLHRTKPLVKTVKSQRPSTSATLSMKRKKLLVGGIFQAKRSNVDVLKSKEREPEAKREGKQNTASIKNNSSPLKSPTDANELEEMKTDDDPESPEDAEDGGRKKRLSGGVAPKEFIIEEDHNHFKCTVEDCGKGFRKESLLASHMKHYHKNLQKDTAPPSKPDENLPIKSSLKQDEPDVQVTSVTKTKGSVEALIHSPAKKIEEIKGTEPSSETKTTKPKSRREASIRHRIFSVLKHADGGKIEASESSVKISPSEPAGSVQPKVSSRKVPREKATAIVKKERSVSSSRDNSSRKRKSTDEKDKKLDTSVKQEPSIKKESDGIAIDVFNIGSQSNKSTPTDVKKSSKKRRLDFSHKKSSKDDDMGGMSYPEMVENHFYDLDAANDIREEVVNCICRFTEEDGLMMQCENCMAWQHGTCFNIEDEKRVPERYICFACRDPKAPRESYKYWYEQGWWKSGEMASFAFLPTQENHKAQKQNVLRAHSLASNIHTVKIILNSLQQKLHVAENSDHPDLQHWKQVWVEINPADNSSHTPNSLIDGENPSAKELTYFDHSYSAVNRNSLFTSSGLGSNIRMLPDIKQENSEPEKMDTSGPATSQLQENVPLLNNVSNEQVLKKENSSEASKGVNTAIVADSNGLSNVNDSIESKQLNHYDAKPNVSDKVIYQLHLLDHIEQLQSEVDRRLEEISQHVELLESEWEVSCPQERLTDSSSFQKAMKMLQSNLHKVQRLATYS